MIHNERAEWLEIMNTIINVRSYQELSVPEQALEDVLYAFSLGPSLANTQPWELLMVKRSDEREQLIASTLDPFLSPGSLGAQAWIKSAPVIVVVMIEKRRALVRLGERGEIFAIQDTFCAIQNARLTAAVHGLSTSVIREFDPHILQKNLELPWYIEPVAILTIGYSEEEKEIPPRLTVAEIIS
ncbi:nitroreductase family protein [Brevibacillus reuszeri]|uniref:nitroreductase family protein n=1 Tax=Brevibacillus reuszeri TaxID=54915 RepID=UPI002896A689|nr:nitroreductase family protein [Brevibacillus reuszeri]